ncbi:hypothetical protein K4K59_001127 [Colletotrichum sp. SAR11_240]|nr:hypothetical protein K4K59_001127 [Colletotrichum sp. SAR11_240]
MRTAKQQKTSAGDGTSAFQAGAVSGADGTQDSGLSSYERVSAVAMAPLSGDQQRSSTEVRVPGDTQAEGSHGTEIEVSRILKRFEDVLKKAEKTPEKVMNLQKKLDLAEHDAKTAGIRADEAAKRETRNRAEHAKLLQESDEKNKKLSKEHEKLQAEYKEMSESKHKLFVENMTRRITNESFADAMKEFSIVEEKLKQATKEKTDLAEKLRQAETARGETDNELARLKETLASIEAERDSAKAELDKRREELSSSQKDVSKERLEVQGLTTVLNGLKTAVEAIKARPNGTGSAESDWQKAVELLASRLTAFNIFDDGRHLTHSSVIHEVGMAIVRDAEFDKLRRQQYDLNMVSRHRVDRDELAAHIEANNRAANLLRASFNDPSIRTFSSGFTALVSEGADGALDSESTADGAVGTGGGAQDAGLDEENVQTPAEPTPTWGLSKTFLEATVDEAIDQGKYKATLDSIWPKTREWAADGDEIETYADAVSQIAVSKWAKLTVMKVKLKLDANRRATYKEMSKKDEKQFSCAYTDWWTTLRLHKRLVTESEFQALRDSGFIKALKKEEKGMPPLDERFRDHLQKNEPAQPAVASSSTAPPPPPPLPPHLQRTEGTKEKKPEPEPMPRKRWVPRLKEDGTVELIEELDAAEAERLEDEEKARVDGIWEEVAHKGKKKKAETNAAKASSHAPTGAVPPKAPTGAPPPAPLGPFPLSGYNEGAAGKSTQQTQTPGQTQTQTQPVLTNTAWPRDPAGQVEASVPKLQQMLGLIQAAGSGITMRPKWRPFVMQTPENRSASSCWATQKLITEANDLLVNKGVKFAWNSAFQLTFRSETRDIGVEETAYLAYLWRFIVMPYHEDLKSHGNRPLAQFINIKHKQLGSDHCRATTNVATLAIAKAIRDRDVEMAAQAQKVAAAGGAMGPLQNVAMGPLQNAKAGAVQPAPPAPKPVQDARVEEQRSRLAELAFQCLRDHVMPGDMTSYMTDLADHAASLLNLRNKDDMRLSASDVDAVISDQWRVYNGDGKVVENAKAASSWYWSRKQEKQTQQQQQT